MAHEARLYRRRWETYGTEDSEGYFLRRAGRRRAIRQGHLVSTVLQSVCVCGSIGNTEGIRLCELCHRYWFNDQEFSGVTSTIGKVWPNPSSFDDAPLFRIEEARYRGSRVDR